MTTQETQKPIQQPAMLKGMAREVVIDGLRDWLETAIVPLLTNEQKGGNYGTGHGQALHVSIGGNPDPSGNRRVRRLQGIADTT